MTQSAAQAALSTHSTSESSSPNVLVIHETDGRKYLEALVALRERGRISSLQFVGSSVAWKFAHSLLRERRGLLAAVGQSLRNLRFRLSLLRIRNRTIILAVAPWDYRLLLYSHLRRYNRFIYNTSWPYWDGSRVPRRSGFLTPLLRRAWIRTLRSERIDVVAVTPAAADGVCRLTGGRRQPTIIPHVVSDAFFARRATYSSPFRLLFIGELSEKKGLLQTRELFRSLKDSHVTLDIVGDGPLRRVAEDLARHPGCRWHGRVANRQRLAEIIGGAQIFVSPVLRTERWEELFGMSVLEAMASGVPAIVSNHTGPRSFIDSGRNGVLVPEHDIEEMHRWITLLMNDPDAWLAMSDQAAATAKKYSLQAASDRWQRLLIGEKRAS